MQGDRHGGDRRLRAFLGGLAVAVAVTLAWSATHPPRPLEPTSDLYTHLSVARHLLRGDGFVTDIAYPLSFAWPFACRLPQPLVHRAPGFALALTGPVALAGCDPTGSVAAVRLFQIACLGLILALGSVAWLLLKRPGAAVGWAVLMATHPLTGYAVDWGHDELLAGGVLLALWLRHRDRPRGPDTRDGLLLGLLALLRPELLWLPGLVWLLRGASRPGARTAALAIGAFLVLAGPWAVRNTRLTGSPVFSVQAHAELMKDTRTFPGYSVYQQLEPQPLVGSLVSHADPVARKIWRGVRFFEQNLGSVLPRPLAAALVLAGFVWFATVLSLAREGRDRRDPAEPGSDVLDRIGPVGLALGLAAVFYAAFDHSLRHLEVLLPILCFECGPLLGDLPWALAPGVGRHHATARAWLVAVTGAAVGLALTSTAVLAPAGWDAAEDAARAADPVVAREVQDLHTATAGVVFVSTSAAPWIADRPAVWDPGNEAVRQGIRARLEEAP